MERRGLSNSLNIFVGGVHRWKGCAAGSSQGETRTGAVPRYLGEGKNWFMSDKNVLSTDQIFSAPHSARNACLGKCCLSKKPTYLSCLDACQLHSAKEGLDD